MYTVHCTLYSIPLLYIYTYTVCTLTQYTDIIYYIKYRSYFYLYIAGTIVSHIFWQIILHSPDRCGNCGVTLYQLLFFFFSFYLQYLSVIYFSRAQEPENKSPPLPSPIPMFLCKRMHKCSWLIFLVAAAVPFFSSSSKEIPARIE